MHEEILGSKLKNCNVLIVEDEKYLAEVLSKRFYQFTSVQPIIAHYMDEANKYVLEEEIEFHLAIVDTMLPKSEGSYKSVNEKKTELLNVRKKINSAREHSLDNKLEAELEKYRYQRLKIIKSINALIEPEGGIDIIEEWRNQQKKFPILFLTAIGKEDIAMKGKRIAGEKSSVWIVKPVNSNYMLKKCEELLAK